MVLGNVAITGATGMVGTHLRELLDHKKVPHIAASRLVGGTPSPGHARWDLAQWKTPTQLDDIFPRATAVVHLGALLPQPDEDRQALFDVNVRSCLCLAEWAQQRDIPLVFLSSASVYKDPDHPRITEKDPTSTTGLGGFYSGTKFLAEEVMRPLVKDGLKLCILRPSSIYGFGLPTDKALTKFLAAAARGETIEIKPPLGDKVNLIHALDVARAIILVLEHGATGTYNIGASIPHSFLDIAKACVNVAKHGQVVAPEEDEATGSIRFDLDCSRAGRAFNYHPGVDLHSGLERMLMDMKKHGQIS